MKEVFSIIFMTAMQLGLTAQASNGCNGSRYIDEIFSTTVQSTVKYGENLNFGILEELYMDIYEPENDDQLNRPMVILAHGGAFAFGDRSRMSDLCIEFAKKGYVAATMDYRKLSTSTPLDSINTVEAIVRTMQDMKAAVRYIKHNSNIYQIDTSFVLVGGYSAGALTALHAAYWSEGDNTVDYINNIVIQEGGLEGQTNDFFDVSSTVRGVINQSGGILDKGWIQATEAALVSYHGIEDNLVPIDRGIAAGAIVLDGSEVIHQQAEALNIPNHFHPVSGGGHDNIFGGAFANEYSNYLDSTFAFFAELLCEQITPVTTNVVAQSKIKVYPNPTSDRFTLEVSSSIIPFRFEVLDLNGRLIQSHSKIGISTLAVDVTSLLPGIYFLRVKTRNQVIVHKFTKE